MTGSGKRQGDEQTEHEGSSRGANRASIERPGGLAKPRALPYLRGAGDGLPAAGASRRRRCSEGRGVRAMRGRGSGNSDEFIREVDEAVRQDRWLRLWKHYGTYIVGGALAIVIGTGAGVAWRNWQESQRLEDARRYAAAEELLRQDRPAEAAAAFLALAEEAGGGYDVVARLRAAEAADRGRRAAAAAAALDRLAESDEAAPRLPAARRPAGAAAGLRGRRRGAR